MTRLNFWMQEKHHTVASTLSWVLLDPSIPQIFAEHQPQVQCCPWE